MLSQFNISFNALTLKCSQPSLEPKFKIVFPDGKKYDSKDSVQNNQGDYVWQDRATFSFLSDRNKRLDKYFVRLGFYDKDKVFIGDVEVDMFTIVTGPMRFELPLDHGINNCRISFIVSSVEYLKTQIKIDNIKIDGLEKDTWTARAKLGSKVNNRVTTPLVNKGGKFVQEKEVILEDVLSYKDLQTDMEIEILRKNNDVQYDIVKFGIHKLYVHNGLEYSLNTSGGHAITLYLTLISKPSFVQALSGIYQGYGRYSGYVPCNGSHEINIKNPDLIRFNEPIAQPSEGCVKTFKPFVSKITLKSLKITGKGLPNDLVLKTKNTINRKREKIPITQKGNEFTVENYHLIQLDTKKPYQLNRRYLIFELLNSDDVFIGDIYLNLHNLFCGPPKYIVDFQCVNSAVSAQAEFTLDVVNGRTMKVNFNGFHLEANDIFRNCYIKFGFEKNEVRYDIGREENNKLYFDGEYEASIFYSTASKNLDAYVINIMVMEKKFLKDELRFSGKLGLINMLPFKTKKMIEITLENSNFPPFMCFINMNTSLVKSGLYGEYQLLESGVYINGKMDFSTFREVPTFTEFSQPPYFPAVIKEGDKSVPVISTQGLDNVECSVLSGADNEDKVKVILTEKDITMIKLDGTILLTHPLNNYLQSSCNTNQLTIITPTSHTQLYTKRARDIKSWIDKHTVASKDEDKKSNIHQGYYVLCPLECKGAISVSCPVCNFHPSDFVLQYYGIAHCDICSFETYIHFREHEDDLDISCPLCESSLRILDDTLQQTYVCSCGFPLGSVCKRCTKVPTFDNPKVYTRTLCGECGQVQLIYEELTSSVPCTKCQANISLSN